METAKRLVLVDGHALLFRAYYAIPFLTAPDGRMMNAVYGFSATLLSVIEELEPTHIAVCFDSKGPTFRKVEFEGYKANRTKPPDELIEQFQVAREVAVALGMPKFEWQGFEADDLIGTLADRAKRKKGVETTIVTGDLDSLQLVEDGKVRVYVPARGKTPAVVYDEAGVQKKLGVRQDQVVELKGLAGDPSDNIPGIKGIGPKTAVKLLNTYGNLEGIYQAVDSGEIGEAVGKAVVEKLKGGKEIAFKSRELATIIRDVPIDFDLEACLLSAYDKEQTVKLFGELGFNSLVKRLPDDDFEKSVQAALF